MEKISLLIAGAMILVLGVLVGHDQGKQAAIDTYSPLIREYQQEAEARRAADEALREAQAPLWCEMMQERWAESE